DGEISFAEVEPAVPLGALADAPFPATRVAMEAGSTLLLYSDGLVEGPDLEIGAGLDRLQRFVATAPCDLDALCEHVAGRALAADADDDVTLLAVRAAGGSAARLGGWSSSSVRRHGHSGFRAPLHGRDEVAACRR
ncbi:MAG: SpoIIE family protein phosphatase, partial [Acidimicrobiales bacterium]|nr:SpoIIE family protein phosphatase [Acidimicrobiales bacterium]